MSIVIPCYNHGLFLSEALASVAAQTYRDFEVIIVDDGSTDADTVRLLDGLEQPGVRVIRTLNRGVSAARNRGISEAAGRFILPLDADDLLSPDCLAKTVPILENDAGAGVVYGACRWFGDRYGVGRVSSYDLRRQLVENLVHATALFRKEDWSAIGGYNEAMVHGWEDWDFWIALSRLHRRFIGLPDVLFSYRVYRASRDRSLRFHRKFWMYLLMMRRNWRSFLRHFPYVVLALCRFHLFRCLHRQLVPQGK